MSPSRSKGWSDPEKGRSDGITPMADVLRGILAQRPFKRGMGVGLLARSWSDVVGERLAAETRPARLDAGTLVVQATSGPWGSQAKFLSEEIKKRANEALGEAVVTQVRVVVAPPRDDRSKPL